MANEKQQRNKRELKGVPHDRQNEKQLKQLQKLRDQVLALEDEFKAKSDEELKNYTLILKQKLANGQSLDSILPEAFALVREASSRVLGMRHYPVQILGGIALHQGKIAEMATGEGKTLVATLPAFLNALTGQGVHIVTTNEYLAKRDAEKMGKVFKWLGLSVGVALSGQSLQEKQMAYSADITYTTNNELGFDYLRDNMVMSEKEIVGRGQAFVIVDEVDSILIDEARTPLILSSQGMQTESDYKRAKDFVDTLTPDDVNIDEKTKQISLNEIGMMKAESYFDIENVSSGAYIGFSKYINNAIRAKFLMQKDKDYIVKDDAIIIIDPATGRAMPDRRYNLGLHQAIEAKEGVTIKNESLTLATVTFQNYFRKYRKLAGMTGTASTSKKEMIATYGLDVVTIPTNKENQRIDEEDVVFTTKQAKLKAIVAEVVACHEIGQPLLLGTASIESSEELSKALDEAGIPHVVLNAKNHEQESEIIAQAGRKGAVTIATNMAGRGTDILLGGNPEFMAIDKMREEGFSEGEISYATAFTSSDEAKLNDARARFTQLKNEFSENITQPEHEEVCALGGLRVIGTERQDSRRVDNQLIGRCARQGDPGSSVFFLSLEDDLFRIFGEKALRDAIKDLDSDQPLEMKGLSKWINDAQREVETQNSTQRRSLLKFDNVINEQREIVYAKRKEILEDEASFDTLTALLPQIVRKVAGQAFDGKNWNLAKLKTELEQGLFAKNTIIIKPSLVEGRTFDEVVEKITNFARQRLNKRKAEAQTAGIDINRYCKTIMLNMLDVAWIDHLDQIEMLKEGIGFRAYANEDPFVAFTREAYIMFNDMLSLVQDTSYYHFINQQLVPVKQNYTPAEQTKVDEILQNLDKNLAENEDEDDTESEI